MDDLFFGIRFALLIASFLAIFHYWPRRSEGRHALFMLCVSGSFVIAFLPATLEGAWMRLGARNVEGALGLSAIIGISGLLAAFAVEHSRRTGASLWFITSIYMTLAAAGAALTRLQ